MKHLRAILCVFLAVLVLVSSTTFIVGLHKCNGKVRTISLLTHAEGCKHKQQLPPCHQVKHKPCCENDNLLHSSDDFSHHTSKIDAKALDQSSAHAIVSEVIVSIIIPEQIATNTDLVDHELPIPSGDLIVRHHVFLI